MKIAFIDNFDSFTFNLVHCLEKAGAKIKVYHNCELFEFEFEYEFELFELLLSS